MNSIPPSPADRLPLWRKIGYGLGDIYGGGSLVVVSFYYLIFLTDVVRLNPALAGTVILISKGYDAITDPFEGVISDRTRTRLGRRRPYLLGGIPLIFLSFFGLFYPINLESESGRFAVVVATYLFFSTVVILVGCSVFFAGRYPLNGQVHTRLNALLARRRSGAAETAETAAEAEALKRVLIV